MDSLTQTLTSPTTSPPPQLYPQPAFVLLPNVGLNEHFRRLNYSRPESIPLQNLLKPLGPLERYTRLVSVRTCGKI